MRSSWRGWMSVAVAVTALHGSAPHAQPEKHTTSCAPAAQAPSVVQRQAVTNLMKSVPSAGGLIKIFTDPQRPAVALKVHFKLNSAELTPDGKKVLDQVAMAVQSPQVKRFQFLIEGHTDCTGSVEYNMILSLHRAETAQKYLVSNRGVAPERLQVQGMGSTEPLDPQHPADGINRRVQFVNLGD